MHMIKGPQRKFRMHLPSLSICVVPNGPEITIVNDVVSRNGISYSKAELAEKIASGLSPDTELDPELQRSLLEPIAKAIGLRD